ncbi:low-density lipoprotein receptor class A domain-containing protein 1 isoform X4 [Rousettus aegyptiacus]|uniref:low-density lipoprotein receptor class A domain-containing protein 1 isoform X4 n=1 Tax=Rousettus aegyptiacus TaxID=9407 RepID=UPI00168CC3B7|nr:low-density lipoprotein receptor class A domain-containing protein 1 isoform X4 [Rousettus aegyptiacus]
MSLGHSASWRVRSQGIHLRLFVALVKNSSVWLPEAGPHLTKAHISLCSLGQEDVNGDAVTGTKALPGREGCGPLCYSRQGACLSASVLLLLITLAALITLIIIAGPPPRAQACVTLTNRTGFLCHDRRSCIAASGVCDGVRTCPHGEDEDESLCRDVPQSLPTFLVVRCGNPSSWIYSDQKCDGTNNCGDCSDELSPVTECPPCGPGWWRCPSTVFKYCGCIPRSLCRDHVQHCSDWSDEYSCPGL